jgi:peptide/nickel transport system ATP-binding protein
VSILEARSLSVAYRHDAVHELAVAELSLALRPGRIVGLAGESGAGKSTLALALAGYCLQGATVVAGEVCFDGVELTRADPRTLRRLWGARIAHLPQDCANALNPALRVGGQLSELLRLHVGLGRAAARTRALELLQRVGIREPATVLARHPHELSGGEQQRVALALAISCDPRVMILDEPTTGLDARTRAHVTELIGSLTRTLEIATLLVSHDLAMLAAICDELYVMYAGRIVEHGLALDVFNDPRHPYTAALIAAIPTIAGERAPRGLGGAAPFVAVTHRCGFADRCWLLKNDCLAPIALRRVGDSREVRCVRAPLDELEPPLSRKSSGRRSDDAGAGRAGEHGEAREEPALLEARDLRCGYGARTAMTPALDGVSFTLACAGSLGVAGESGAGKTTLLRALAGLTRPAAGELRLAGAGLAPSLSGRSREQRRAIQIVFQNPDATLNPRQSVAAALERPLKLFRDDVLTSGRRAASIEALERVELPSRILERLPRELSAGQRQRVAIARALIPGPRVLLCDEPTSALDVSAQAAVIELLNDLRESERLALVFVSHDLGLLRHVADELLVLEQGTVREAGAVDDVLLRPRHRYTSELIAALPDPSSRVA